MSQRRLTRRVREGLFWKDQGSLSHFLNHSQDGYWSAELTPSWKKVYFLNLRLCDKFSSRNTTPSPRIPQGDVSAFSASMQTRLKTQDAGGNAGTVCDSYYGGRGWGGFKGNAT